MPTEICQVMASPGCMPRWISGMSQPIRYCAVSSATTSQCNTFAVVPYCVTISHDFS